MCAVRSVASESSRPRRTQRTLFCLLAAPQEDPPIYFLLLAVALIVLWIVATAGGEPLCAPLTTGTRGAARGVELTDPVASGDDNLDDKNV